MEYLFINKTQENEIKRIIENGYKMGYSKTHKLIQIMYVLFKDADLIYHDKELAAAEKAYEYYK
jgi:hypothetical protein